MTYEMRRLGLHIMALQECRETVDAIRFHEGICKIAGPASDGKFGCQIWVVDCACSLGACVDGELVTWARNAFTILHKDPRILIVGAQAGVTRFALVAAHACTSTANEEEREQFWTKLRVAMKAIPRGHIPLVMIDANAKFEHGTTTPVLGCENADKSKELAQAHDLWLSGNVDSDRNGKALVTWVHPGTARNGGCIDYIAVPCAWSLGAEVVGDPGLLDVHAGHDHFPVVVELRACLSRGRESRRVDGDVEQLLRLSTSLLTRLVCLGMLTLIAI